MNPVLRGLLIEAYNIASVVAESRSGQISNSEYQRFRRIAPYLLHKLPPPPESSLLPLNADRRPLGLAVNRDYAPIGSKSAQEVYEAHPQLVVPDSEAVRACLDDDLSLFSDHSAPWRSRAAMKRYALRLDTLIAALDLADARRAA
jgi:hypothetical protein